MITFQATRLSQSCSQGLSSGPNPLILPSNYGTDHVCFGAAQNKKALEPWDSPKTQQRLSNFYRHHQKQYDEIQQYLKQLFPEELGELVFRFKEPESFLEKAKSKHEKNTGAVKDCIGARLILKTASNAEVEEVVERLKGALARKEVKLSLIIHSWQEGNFPGRYKYYFHPQGDIQPLKAVSNFQQKRFSREDALNSGSIFDNMTFWKPGANKHARGTYFSLQLCGPQVHPLMEVEHLFYAVIIAGKKLPPALQDIEIQMKGLTDSQKHAYAGYLRLCYLYARDAEQNFWCGFRKPKYPEGLPADLRVEALAQKLVKQDPALARWTQGNPLFNGG